MALSPGARLGPYEIQSSLGAGGMGEVYKATDTRLGRVVAVKVLRDYVGADSTSRERFAREAKAISSLNHAHICALYDVGTHDGIDFLVLEYLEGETLADRVARGPLPLREALNVARQIAGALEAAHDNGIVHRDLKPDNIKILADGQVKVLDFGLAKTNAGKRADLSDSPTVMTTTPGLIMGTAAYMSPEQARGEEADRTSDRWAFGCVLFEMLTGRRAFGGGTMSEVLANVLKTQPDWQRLPADLPASLQRLLRRSLEKDQKLRFRDMRDARLEMDDVQSDGSEHDRVAAPPSRRLERLAWASALALVALLAALLGFGTRRSAPTPSEVRLDVTTPPTRSAALALSPDGSRMVFVATSDGQSRMWLRSLDGSVMRLLAGTERSSNPFWSPDGRSIGFFTDGNLKRMDIDGGSPRTLARADVPLGGTWNGDGTILFGNNPGGPILRVAAEGGETTTATEITSAQHRGHASPRFLPDGQHFLFFVNGSPEERGIYVGALGSLKATRLAGADGPASYLSTGHLLFVRQEKLWAHSFDPSRLALSGDAFPIAESVTAGTAVSTSAVGTIAYRTPPANTGQRQLVWFDRSGRETAKVVYADTAGLGPGLSPDGRHVAVFRVANGLMDIWSYDTNRRTWEKITFDPGDDIYPLWSRDGASIVFGGVRTRQGAVDLYRRVLNAPQGREELLLSTPAHKNPLDLSPDERFLLYQAVDLKLGLDIWALPLQGDRKPFEVVRTEFNEGLAQFSPDGQWVAYQSDKTGRSEIYLRAFPGPGDEQRVSIDGGAQVRWNPNGQELFYIAADDRLVAMPIHLSKDRKTVEPGAPLPLFPTSIGSTAPLFYRQQYVVSPDGKTFVMNTVVGDATASPITVILNWKAQAAERR